MAEFPAMPLFTDAYLGDTRHLTTTEHGAYILLLMISWRSGGSLPNDDKLLARYAGLRLDIWRRIKPTIMEFFTVRDDRIVQLRLLDELRYVRELSALQSVKGKASALKRKERAATAVQSGANRNPTPIPTPIPIEEREGKPSPKKAVDRAVAWKEGDAIPVEWRQWAKDELRWSEPRVASEANKFVDYALAHRKTYVDWRAAWRQWCRSPYQKAGVVDDGGQRKLRV